MDVVLGALLLLASAAVTLWSVRITRAAAPNSRIARMRPTLHRPTSATFLHTSGVALALLSGFLLLDLLGAFAALAPALVGTAWFIAVAVHNRQLENRPGTGA